MINIGWARLYGIKTVVERIYTPNKFPLQQEQQQYARLLFAQRQGMVCQYGKTYWQYFLQPSDWLWGMSVNIYRQTRKSSFSCRYAWLSACNKNIIPLLPTWCRQVFNSTGRENMPTINQLVRKIPSKARVRKQSARTGSLPAKTRRVHPCIHDYP